MAKKVYFNLDLEFFCPALHKDTIVSFVNNE